MFSKEVISWTERFWSLAGRFEPFPRSLEVTIAKALPLAIVKLPHLGLQQMQGWLKERNIFVEFEPPDRSLRACLIARAGRGIVFLDGCDAADEQRLSLAHEVAHFLKDYLHPREKVISCFGEGVKGILDGQRPPTPEERLKGIFKGIHLGTYTNLLERSPKGDVHRMHILDTEDFADQIAIELLAPHLTVIQRVETTGVHWKEDRAIDVCVQILTKEFGLPSTVARKYGTILVMAKRQVRSFREWLGGRSP